MTLASVTAGIFQARNAAKAIYLWETRLRSRLKQELLYNVCGSKCPIEKQEIVLLQEMIDKNDPHYVSDDPKDYKRDEDREWGNRGDYGANMDNASNTIGHYCATISGFYRLPTGGGTDAERAAVAKVMNDCRASYKIKPGDFRLPGGGPAEIAHQAVWAECLKVYDRSKSVYDQTAYNACMNKRDIPTQLCTKLREQTKNDGVGKLEASAFGGSCPGPQPLDVHDLGLGLPPRQGQ